MNKSIGFLLTIVLLLAIPIPSTFARTNSQSASNMEISATQDLQSTANLDLERVSQVGGRVAGLAVMGELAFVGVGPRLMIFDIQNPAAPVRLSQSEPFAGVISEIAVSGNFAYVGLERFDGYELIVVDILDPADLVVVRSIEMPDLINDLEVAGIHLIVALNENGISVVDISNPLEANEVGTISTSGAANRIAVAGDHVFIADGFGGLRVIEFSDPANATEIGYVLLTDYALALAVANDKAYVSGRNQGLFVIDISDPTHPVIMGASGESMHSGIGKQDISLMDDHAFLAAGDGGLRVVDISDPANPTEIKYLRADLRDFFTHIAVIGANILVVEPSGGVKIFATSDLTGFEAVGFFETVSNGSDLSVTAVAAQGNLVYQLENEDFNYSGFGLRVLDVADPTAPAEIGFLEINDLLNDIDIQGEYAYVVCYYFAGPAAASPEADPGLRVIDIHDPSAPIQVAELATPADGGAIDIAGNYAYLANVGAGLRIIDISDPLNPIEAGSLATAGAAIDVVVSGDYAYVVISTAGVSIINVSDPENPFEVASLDNSYAHNVDLDGDILYIGGSNGIVPVDVSDPQNPIERSRLISGRTPIVVQSPYIFTLDSSQNLLAVDITEPQNLHITDELELGYFIAALDAVPGLVFAGGLGGLTIVNTDAMEQIGSISMLGEVVALQVWGDYLIGGYSNVHILDKTDPSDLEWVSSIALTEENYPYLHVLGLTAYGNYAYITDSSSAYLQVLDLHDLSQPAWIESSASNNIIAAEMEAINDMLYCASDNAMKIVDIRDPAAPATISSFSRQGLTAHKIFLDGSYAYLGSGYSDFWAVDISDPSQPVEAGRLETRVKDIYVADGRGYLANGNNGLHIVDLSDHASMQIIHTIVTGYYVGAVAVSGEHVFLLDESGLRVFDITDALNPVEIAYMPTPGAAYDLKIDNENIYIADISGGLIVMHLEGPMKRYLPMINKD